MDSDADRTNGQVIGIEGKAVRVFLSPQGRISRSFALSRTGSSRVGREYRPEGRAVKYNDEQRELLKAIRLECESEEKSERQRARKAAWAQRGTYNTMSDLDCIGRLFYTLKGIICLWFRRHRNISKDMYPFEYVDGIAIWTSRKMPSPYGDIHFISELCVGRGIIWNWHYDIIETSD